MGTTLVVPFLLLAPLSRRPLPSVSGPVENAAEMPHPEPSTNESSSDTSCSDSCSGSSSRGRTLGDDTSESSSVRSSSSSSRSSSPDAGETSSQPSPEPQSLADGTAEMLLADDDVVEEHVTVPSCVTPAHGPDAPPQPPLASPGTVADGSGEGGEAREDTISAPANEVPFPQAASLSREPPLASPAPVADDRDVGHEARESSNTTLTVPRSSNRSPLRKPPPSPLYHLSLLSFTIAGTRRTDPSGPPAGNGAQSDSTAEPRGEKRPRFVPFVVPLEPRAADDDLPGREYTVLYRPVARRSHFLAASGDAIAAFLSGVPGAHRVRPNLRRNVVAVDTLPGEDLTARLAVRVVCDVRVRAKALILNTCTGTLFDVDPTFDGATIYEGLESSVPVLAVTRSGDVVTLRFAGSSVPEEVLLFRRRRAVRPRLPRPLQCGRCGLFGHATVTCSRDPRCLHACTVERHRCLHCGGAHAATEPRCPQWQLERRVAAALANSKPRITRKQALELARGSGATAAL
ncbi:hypothetical protein HPB49_026280 [Dermacentor silvarum]|nr:hypothetical protein HPB49_026280 [Dermacentor silvarum]